MYNVLIACLENWDALQEIPFVLKKGGCSVDVFCSRDSWLLSNKFFDKWIESNSDIDVYKQQLIELVENKNPQYDWVILGDEYLLKMMNDCIESETLFKKILPLTKIENREILASKAGFSAICEKYSILSPKYIIYKDDADFDLVTANLNYPVLLKPDLSWGGSGIMFCKNSDSLKLDLEKVSVKHNLVIQEFITGKDIGAEALFKDGELITYNCSEVLEYFDSKFTFTSKRKYFDNAEVESRLITLGRCLGINGFASINYIYQTEHNSYYLIEADLRPNFWVSHGRFTGHDFSMGIKKIITADLNLTPILSGKKNAEKEIEVALFYRDIRRCWKKKDYRGLLKWIFNYKNYWRYIPLYDTILLKRIFKEIAKDFFKKIRKRDKQNIN